MRWSLTVVGDKGSLEVLRGGWGGSRSSYTLNMQLAGQEPSSKQYGFSGTSREMASFLDMVSNRAWDDVLFLFSCQLGFAGFRF